MSLLKQAQMQRFCCLIWYKQLIPNCCLLLAICCLYFLTTNQQQVTKSAGGVSLTPKRMWASRRHSVRKIFLLSLILIGLGVLLLYITPSKPPEAPSSAVIRSPQKNIQYKSYTLDQSVVHTLLIPANSHFLVTPALSQELSSLESFAQEHQAVAVINGGFFDPVNRKSTSYVVRQEFLVADPSLNKRLMNNPKLVPYLKKILNRTEFRRYLCGQTVRYDIALHTEPPLPNCRLVDTLGGGPRLLPELTSVQEGFLDFSQGQVIRDPLRSNQPDARTAVGITREGSLLWIVVAQKPEAPTSSGMSLQTLAAFMKTLGVEKAINLDGGSSCGFYYKGQTVYGKVNEQGNLVRRNVKSVLLVQVISEILK